MSSKEGAKEGVKESILSKIRKLLNLARNKGATQPEAEAAAEMAGRLMQQHQVEEADIRLQEANSTEAVVLRERIGDFGGTCTWALGLANAVGHLFDCQTVNTTAVDSRSGGKGSYIAWCGLPEDVEMSRELFRYLLDTETRIAHGDLQEQKKQFLGGKAGGGWKAADSRRYNHDHGCGFKSAIGRRISEQVKARKSALTTTTTGTALVVVKDQLVVAAKKKAFPSGLVKGQAAQFRHSDGYRAGQTAGANAALGRRIEG